MTTLEARRKTVGQLFAVGFHGLDADDRVRSLVCDYGVGAIVLFKRNVRDAPQLRALCLALQRLARDAGHDQPLLIGIDQENGLAMGILRDDIGFQGVIMTDCMEMDGVRATYGTVEGSLMALQAGADNVMICHTHQVQTAAIDRVCQALESGEISSRQIQVSLGRLSELKSRFTSWDDALHPQAPEALSAMNKRSEELAKQVYRDATTLVRSQAGLLPLSRTAKTPTVEAFSAAARVLYGKASAGGKLPVRSTLIRE
ncbi:glycoside hydrolase family 3 [Ophiocordyceps sinensis CO18]|uniref:Glycoside hydrolase family 3 n=1 Tax=Ophiocordyceps sinensis (strain Co18 / CGMCC 3.14243) TaxID=911162 RepID=T5AC87_OPHSC|nr:glycoside hydrolase family 3 [Ophiocordyceps sinensis CO18]